jgi:hypothetical protein
MGNYFPLANPATNFYFKASGPITGGDPLEFSGDGQVQRAAGSGRYAGIAGQDAAAGQSFAAYVGNATFSGTAEGAVHSGDDLAASDVPGHQVKTAPPGADVIGRAFSDAADGASVKWHQK